MYLHSEMGRDSSRPRGLKSAPHLILFFALLIAPFAHAQDCPNPPATLIAPADNAENVPATVTFEWQPVTGALGYEVWARFNDTGDFEQLGGTSDTNLSEDVGPDTTVEWYVVTNFDTCKSE